MRSRTTTRPRPSGAACAALLLCALAALQHAPGHAAVPTGFNDRLVVGGLDAPVGLAWLPDGRLLFVEQKSARVRLLVNGALAATDPVATIDNVRTQGNEQGLLGIAVDPGWPERPYVYVHCDNQGTSTIRVSRYTVTGDLGFTGNGALQIDVGSRYDLFDDAPDQQSNHNGGTLRFGPDGMLYVSLGEDAVPCAAQTLDLRGKILRLDVSRLPAGPGGPAPRVLIAAPGNPFPAVPDSNALLVWAHGLRNPFRFHIDPDNGVLFIADVGEGEREEVSRAPTGGLNFGWPLFEGFAAGPYACPGEPPPLTGPIYDYDRSSGTAAVISGGVYRAPAGASNPFPPQYEGDYFFSDYYFGFLRRLTGSGNTWSIAPGVAGQPSAADWGTGYAFVSDYLVGPDGSLWYCRQFINFGPNTGQIRRIVYGSDPDTMPPPGGGGEVTFARPFPLPAIGGVNLRYTLAAESTVEMHVYDMRGALVETLIERRTQGAGTYDVLWEGTGEGDVQAGIYFVRLRAGGRDLTHTVPLLR